MNASGLVRSLLEDEGDPAPEHYLSQLKGIGSADSVVYNGKTVRGNYMMLDQWYLEGFARALVDFDGEPVAITWKDVYKDSDKEDSDDGLAYYRVYSGKGGTARRYRLFSGETLILNYR